MEEDYLKAKKKGDKQVQRAIAEGRYPYLPALEDLIGKTETGREVRIGLAEIPIEQVVGTKTKGRQNAFSYGFMPILSSTSEFGRKWAHLVDAQRNEGIRDAVKAYEYLQKFYVEEGNKRVSVTKYADMPLILAEITRIMPAESDEKWAKVYKEFCEFYDVAPIYGLEFSEEGDYAKLAEAVGQNLTDPWPEETVKSVKSAFNYFKDSFFAKGGSAIEISPSDAFLVYVKIYGIESLMTEGKSAIEKKLAKIWNELLTGGKSDSIELVETPEVIDKAGAPSAMDSLIGIIKSKPYSEKNPLKIAFLYEKTPDESSWIYAHEMGRSYLEQEYAGLVKTEKYVGCTSDEVIRMVIDRAAAEGTELFITTSPAQMPQTLRCAIEYPKLKFMNCSINLSANAVRTYYGKMFEAKFLMGAIAAQYADNHWIGYLADYPIYGTCANINAFAIGAAMVDPQAKIFLRWSSSKDTDWRKDMVDAKVSVLSGPDMIKPEESSREYGIIQLMQDGSTKKLAAPVWNWGRYYQLIVDTIFKGTWNAREIAKKDRALNYWWGMKSGVIDVIASQKTSYYSRKMIEILKNAIVEGTLSPFDGELRSQTGIIKEEGSPRLTQEEIITMDWLNDNVVGSLPAKKELVETAKGTVSVSGVDALNEESAT